MCATDYQFSWTLSLFLYFLCHSIKKKTPIIISPLALVVSFQVSTIFSFHNMPIPKGKNRIFFPSSTSLLFCYGAQSWATVRISQVIDTFATARHFIMNHGQDTALDCSYTG